MSFLYIKTPWGQLNVKLDRNSLPSERFGMVPTKVIGPIRFTWRAKRKVAER